MKRETVLSALTAANLFLLGGTMLLHAIPETADAKDNPGLLRGSGLEIVDPSGRVRASLTIQPPVEGATETVLLRLIDAAGQPSVKIAASMIGSGLSFVGGDDESYLVLDAERAKPRLKMVGSGGRERVIEP